MVNVKYPWVKQFHIYIYTHVHMTKILTWPFIFFTSQILCLESMERADLCTGFHEGVRPFGTGGSFWDLWIGWVWMVTSGMVIGFFILKWLKWLILMSSKNRMIKNHWMIFVMILFVVLVLRWFWLCWSSCQLSCCSWFLNCFTVMTMMMMMIIIRICLFSSCSSSSLATFSSS